MSQAKLINPSAATYTQFLLIVLTVESNYLVKTELKHLKVSVCSGFYVICQNSEMPAAHRYELTEEGSHRIRIFSTYGRFNTSLRCSCGIAPSE